MGLAKPQLLGKSFGARRRKKMKTLEIESKTNGRRRRVTKALP